MAAIEPKNIFFEEKLNGDRSDRLLPMLDSS